MVISSISSRLSSRGWQLLVLAAVSVVSVGALLFFCVSAGFHYANTIALFLGVGVVVSACICVWKSFAGDAPHVSLVLLFCTIVFAGCGYATVFTPLTVPDEDYHFAASYEWSNVLLGKPLDNMQESHARVMCDERMSYILSSESLEAVSDNFEWLDSKPDLGDTTIPEYLVRYAKIAETKQGIYSYVEARGLPALTNNVIQAKLPSVLGLCLGRLLGLGLLPLFYLGRIFNVIACALLITLAVKITPKGKSTMAAIAILPMTLHEIGSYSYDGMTIALAFLAIALLVEAASKKSRISFREGLALYLVVSLLAPCKVIYFLIAFIVFLVPSSRFGSRRNWLLFCIGLIATSIAMVALFRFSSLLTVTGSSRVAVAEKASDGAVTNVLVGETISVPWAISHPVEIAQLLIRTLSFYFGSYVSTFIGLSLAWRQTDIIGPVWVFVATWGLLILAMFDSRDDAYSISKRNRVVFFAVFAGGFFAVFASMLFGSTTSESEYIVGIQGRYFTPFAPLAFMAAHPTRFKLNFSPFIFICYAMGLVSLVYLSLIVARVV